MAAVLDNLAFFTRHNAIGDANRMRPLRRNSPERLIPVVQDAAAVW